MTNHSKRTIVQLGCHVELFGFVVFIFKDSPTEVFLKNVFLKTSENSQESTCTGVSFPLFFWFVEGKNNGMDPSINFCGPFAIK